MSLSEANDWRRFFMIYGPVGERRLDVQFDYLRLFIAAAHSTETPNIDECRLKFDWKHHFPQDALSEIEEMVANADKDIEAVLALGRKIKAN
jgi:hypothetical protein